MEQITKLLTSLFAAALLASPLAAQSQAIELSGDVMLEKTIVDEAGVTAVKLVEPTTIVPGDRLVFGTDYINTSTESVDNFVVTNPLPAAVRLAPDADPALTVSVDGGKSWGTLSELTVANEDGSTRAAEHADVTHVRWTLASVAADTSGRLEYPAIIR